MKCRACGAVASASARFCDQCGTGLAVLTGPAGVPALKLEPAGAGNAGLAGERKLLTALIADIKDSVRHVGAMDLELAHRVIHSVLAIMVDSVVKFDGYVLQTVGDGIYAAFGAPKAYHDHAQRAVYAAIEMQNRLRAHARNVKRGEPVIEVRVGVESGEVVLGSLDNGRESVLITVGQTVNLAARLQSVAPPGAVSIGEQTKRLVEGYFALKERPARILQGISEPVAIYEVTGLGRLRRHSQISARREFSAFVGRARELEVLQGAFGLAAAGSGQLVSISTEPGVGKSRLLSEFAKTLPLACKIVEAYAVSHGRKIPWLPAIEILFEYFGVLEADGPDTRRRKIRETLMGLDIAPGEIQPYLFPLLGIPADPNDPLAQMDPRVRRDRTADAIAGLLVAESARQPVVLMFEDLHWIDEQTEVLLQRLVGGIGRACILVLTTYRPEYVPSWPRRERVTHIDLAPLSMRHSDAMLSMLLGDGGELAVLKQLIAERAAGNPFFVEEIVNGLFEDGTLRREGDAVRLTAPVDTLLVPMTVQGMLAERIDQMAPRAKEMLGLLSVVGQGLPIDVVLGASRWSGEETERVLAELKAADFIYDRSPVQAGANEFDYAFKHAMTREVAYRSILAEQKRALHSRVGGTIELLYKDRLDDRISALAYHYAAADDHLKAIEYLGKAGRQAIARSAHREAIAHIRDALGRIALLPEGTVGPAESAGLWLTLGVSLQVTNGYASGEVGLAYERAREMSVKAQDELGLAVALRGGFLFNATRANYGGALREARDLVGLGGSNSAYMLEGYVALGVAHSYLGEFDVSVDFFTKARGLEDDAAHLEQLQYSGHTRVNGRSFHALCLANLGGVDRALGLSREALGLAEDLARPITSAHTLGLHATILHKWRAYEDAEVYYDETIACASRNGFPYWKTFA